MILGRGCFIALRRFGKYIDFMPRKPRLFVPGALHHVMARGIEGRSIFNDDEDRFHFLSLLSEGIAQCGFKCYAWVLMDNHYHLLLRTNEKPLSVLMRSLNSKYARWFRKKNHSSGYVFQDRFKSIVTQDQGYIEQLVRYIHLNPIRARKCKTIANLDHHPWSGHAVLMGTKQSVFQDTRDILRRFGKDHRIAVQEYRRFIQEGIDRDDGRGLMKFIRMNNKDAIDRHEPGCWIIGDQEFVKAALEHDKTNRLQVASYRKNGWTIQKVVEEVARQLKIDAGEILKRGRGNERSIFRKVAAALSHRVCGMPIIGIARFYGIGAASVSRMLDAGEQYAREKNISLKQ